MTTTQENLQSSKLGTMPVGRLILTMSGPAILSMLVQALYNIVDSVFIGMYDATNGVLALSYAMPMQLLVNAFAIGLAVGAGSLISRLLGEGRNKDASLAAQTGLLISFFTACDDEEVQARAIDLDSAQYRIFFDDFDGELDTTVWNTLHERRKGGYWDKDQVLTENGNLVIRTVEKDGTFYTGAVDSMNKKELLFGYFEARCYLPKASGIWSAF